ncbi:MAG TPA: hypothetical protein VN726_06385 [Hanamia sp.]|nr:hypothetical protein [Hanamia sp.]
MVHHTVSLEIGKQEEIDNSLVKVLINYPKTHKGSRFFKEGDVREVAKETAEKFISMGIASYVEAPESVPPENVEGFETEDSQKEETTDEVAKETAENVEEEDPDKSGTVKKSVKRKQS